MALSAWQIALDGDDIPLDAWAMATDGEIVSGVQPQPQPTPAPSTTPARAGGGGGWAWWPWPKPDVCDIPPPSDPRLEAAWRLLCAIPKPEGGREGSRSSDASPTERLAAVERLRRLVALSGSDNIHEARVAADQVARMLREKGLVEEVAAYLGRTVEGDSGDPIASVVRPLLDAAPEDRTALAVLAAVEANRATRLATVDVDETADTAERTPQTVVAPVLLRKRRIYVSRSTVALVVAVCAASFVFGRWLSN